MRRKWFSSLQSKYMLIILVALVLFQLSYLLVVIVFTGISNQQENSDIPKYVDVEQSWHGSLRIVSDQPEEIDLVFSTWKKKYPEAAMFWVNGQGQLMDTLGIERELPEQWTSTYTISYMKESYGNDPYTVVAFISGEVDKGFAVIELPRYVFQPPAIDMIDRFGIWMLIGVTIVVVWFIVISYLFFRQIRKRLLRLQRAMSTRNNDELPVPITVKKSDEIGQLEHAFNRMVGELSESRRRELDEERIRRELIANLSHDIRTPLTKLRANAYTVSKFELPPEGSSALTALDSSVRHIDELVDNLLAYTLLSSEQYRYEPQELHMHRFLREHVAAWYAVFEQEGFEIEMKLEPLDQASWQVDPIWMKRIIDNLLQNVLRHAKEGRYVAIETEAFSGFDVIRIVDRGAGMDGNTAQKGAGIGLSIVDMMVEGMGLTWTSYHRDRQFVVELRHPYGLSTSS